MDATDVLIVEDHASARTLMRQAVLRHGFQVRTAETVAEALAALDPTPDCVILDLVLADGDGETVLAKIRSERIPVRVVAVVTGISDVIRLRRVTEYRPELLLYKPIDPDVLLRLCTSVLHP